MDNKLGFALQALERGWYIFPCDSTSKVPRWKWSESATNDAELIARWWLSYPSDNIGIACKPSGLVVVDLDMAAEPRNILGREFTSGHEALGWIAKKAGHAVHVNTYTVFTPKGGMHLYYRPPADVVIANRPMLGAAGLIDVRASGGNYGGYVLAHGSTGTSGVYRAAEPHRPVAELPPWMVEILKERPRPKHMKSPYTQPTKASWTSLGDTVRNSVMGQRNSTLHWAACIIAEEGGSVDDAVEILLEAFLSTGEHHSEEEGLATILSAFRNTVGA